MLSVFKNGNNKAGIPGKTTNSRFPEIYEKISPEITSRFFYFTKKLSIKIFKRKETYGLNLYSMTIKLSLKVLVFPGLNSQFPDFSNQFPVLKTLHVLYFLPYRPGLV